MSENKPLHLRVADTLDWQQIAPSSSFYQRRLIRDAHRPPRPVILDPVAHFWGKVASGSPTSCWEWTGYRTPLGYGVTSLDGASIFAHRAAFRLSGGVLIPGLVIMHLCDNPPCCNPAHLRQGTHKDNTQDAVRKGRMKWPALAIFCHQGHPIHTTHSGYRYCKTCCQQRHRDRLLRSRQKLR